MNILKKIKIKIVKKYIKKKKIFFEETNLTSLPAHNFSEQKNFSDHLKDECNKFRNNKNNPGPYTCNYLIPFIKNLNSTEINFLDIGAGSLKNYFSLINNLKNLNYFFYDLPTTSKTVEIIAKEEKLKKISILDFSGIKNQNFDLIFLGSTIQYIADYEHFVLNLLKLNPKFILFSALPCFHSSIEKKKFFIIKQLNLYPDINYLYQFNVDEFKKIFLENNFKELFSIENTTQPYMNFNNFKNKNITPQYIDLIFKNDPKQ